MQNVLKINDLQITWTYPQCRALERLHGGPPKGAPSPTHRHDRCRWIESRRVGG